MSNRVYLLLGSNMGDRRNNLAVAAKKIAEKIGTPTICSSVYETQSWGYEDDDYLNQVVACDTEMPPLAVLTTIDVIEKSMGRIRYNTGYHARTIDIDILFYNDIILNTPNLEIPHPKVHLRRFALTPMCELAPKLIHPTLHKTMYQLLEDCNDRGRVKLIEYIEKTTIQ